MSQTTFGSYPVEPVPVEPPVPMPDTVAIGPYTFTLTSAGDAWTANPKAETASMYGHTDMEHTQILLHPNCAPTLGRTIVVHEVLHAVAFTAGHSDQRKRTEEDWVLMVAPLLLDTLRRNPALTAYLLGS